MREKILNIIEKNARLSMEDLAALLGEEEECVTKEVQAMEAEGIICGYHTLINWDNTKDERVDALIEVKVTPQRGMGFDSIAERIYQYEEVDALYLMSGGYDIRIMGRGLQRRRQMKGCRCPHDERTQSGSAWHQTERNPKVF